MRTSVHDQYQHGLVNFVIDSYGTGRQMEQKDLGNRTHQKIVSRCYQKKCNLRDQAELVGLGMFSLNGCLN